MTSCEISDFYKEALQCVEYIYAFIYILEDPKDHLINRKNHLSAKGIIMEKYLYFKDNNNI
jgi:hypothetical protein